MSDYFDLIWVPNSGKCSSNPSMGYNPVYWMSNHNSSFGTEAELREMIKTFSAFGTGIIEDVVVNHRDGVSSWTDFPTETYKGVTYEWGPWAICSTDEVANAEGQEKPTGAPDTGDDFNGCRDLDHTNAKVQAGIKAYLDFLRNELGYIGWRYDMVKGFGGEFIKIYNESIKTQYSVGEYWDGYDNITKWIEKTGRTSAAFDFPFKYALNEAFSGNDYSKLAWPNEAMNKVQQPAGLVHMPDYRRYAVTFVDNHDTYRDDNKFTGSVMAANAFLLCSPGTPCVFMRHWLENKAAIKELIAIRKSVGITNQSEVTVHSATKSLYLAEVKGTNGNLLIKIGRGSANLENYGYSASDKVAGSGAYAVYTKVPIKSLDTERPTITFAPEGGFYLGGVDVTLTSSDANAQIAYTTDGTTPSATNGTKVASGTTIRINKKTTLKAVALVGGEMASSIVTDTYRTEYTPVTIYLQKPSEWSTVNFYAWSDTYEAADLLGNWPGKNMSSSTVEQDGYTWYKYTTPQECDVVNIIFNNCASSSSEGDQTVDITDVEGTHYYVLNSPATGKSVTVTDVTSQFGGVASVASEANVTVYPNPATDVVRVSSAKEVASIEVYSASGSLAARSEGVDNVDVAGLQSGFYLYRVVLADGSIAQGKVVKK